MVELMVAVVILAILTSAAAPNIAIWVQNTKIRTTSEAILNGLQLARAEAVKRNALVRFQLTDSLTAACALSTTSSNWVISINDPTGLCNTPPADPPSSPTAPNPASAYIIQTRGSSEGSSNVTVAAPLTFLVFSGLGRLSPTPAGNLTYSFTNPTGGLCTSAGGPMRCMSVIVTPGGQIRMCDPALPSTNSQGC